MNTRQTCDLALALTIVLMSSPFAAGFAAEPGREGVGASLRPDRLRCEYLTNPLGIDARAPRLSWTLRAVRPEARGLTQAAYQVLVAPSEASLAKDEGGLWDTGKVASDRSLHVPYGGRPLRSHDPAGGRCGSGTRTGRPPGGASPPGGPWASWSRPIGGAAGSAGTAGMRAAGWSGY